MKKLSEHQKWWSDRDSKRKALLKHTKRHISNPSNDHANNNSNTPQWVWLTSPENLDLIDNTDETLAYFNKIRKVDSSKPMKIDLMPLKNISTECVVILAAEMQRHELMYSKRFYAPDYPRWHQSVKQQLIDVGLFEILKIKVSKSSKKDKNLHWIGLISNNKFDNNIIQTLRDNIIELIKQISLDEIVQDRLYGTLYEPTGNTLEHAYPEGFDFHEHIKDRWWSSASYNSQSNVLSLIVYDMGITIPMSIKNKYEIEDNKVVSVKKGTTWAILNQKSDGDIIKLAINNKGRINRGRSATKLENRGYGLSKMKQFIKNNFKGGRFRVTSGKGRCTHLIGSYGTNLATDVIVENLIPKLNGTLIEWEITL